jgi:hypothetical protein
MHTYPVHSGTEESPGHNIGVVALDMALPTQFWPGLVPAGDGNIYTGGVPPVPTWSAIPNFLNQTTSLTVNIATTYLTPTSGVTIGLAAGYSLPAGWAFDGTHLTYDGTTVNGSPGSVKFTAHIGAGAAALSNQFTVQGAGSATSDTLAPTIPIALAASNVLATTATVGGITPSDPNQPGHTWKGLNKIKVYVNAVLNQTVIIGPGNQPTTAQVDLGAQTSSFSLSGADLTITTTAVGTYPTADAYATDFQQLTGTSWVATCRIDAFSAPEQFDTAGLMVRASMGASAPFVAIMAFPFASGNGILSKFRPTLGGNDTNLAQANGVISGSAYLTLARSGDTYSLYYSLDGVTQIPLGTRTQVFGSTVYIGRAATTNSGISMTVTIKQLSIQTLANWSANLTGLTAGTTYPITVTAEDAASTPNVSALSASLSLTTAASSSITFNPGLWREDQAMQNGYGAAHRGFANLGSVTADAGCIGLLINACLGSFESTLGTYDFTLINDCFATLKAAGKKLMIMMHMEAVPFVSFANTYSQGYLPPYFNDTGGANVYGGSLNIYFGNTYGGQVCCFNRTAVLNRVVALYQALANFVPTGETLPLKSNPVFEGLMLQETAYYLGTGGQVTNNYDGLGSQAAWDNAYCANYASFIQQARSIFANKALLYRANWGTNANMISIATACKNYASGLDNTDGVTDYCAMDDVIQNLSIIQPNSSTLGDLRGVIPLYCCSESVGQNNGGFNITAANLVAYAVNTAAATGGPWKVNYLIPSRNAANSSDSLWPNSPWNSIESALAGIGGTVATKPSTYP